METPWKTLFISKKLSKTYRRQPRKEKKNKKSLRPEKFKKYGLIENFGKQSQRQKWNKENVTNPKKGYSKKKFSRFF